MIYGGSLKYLWSKACFADYLNSGFKDNKDEIKSKVVLSNSGFYF